MPVIKRWPPVKFQFHMTAEVHPAGVKDGPPVVVFKMEATDDKGAPLLSPLGAVNDAGLLIELPFKSPEEAEQHVGKVRTQFKVHAHRLMLLEGLNFLNDLREQVGIESFGDNDPRETIEFHLSRTETWLNHFFGIKPPAKRNGRGQWGADDLWREVRAIAKMMPKGERSFDRVAEALKERVPDRAPASGEALRKLCGRLGIGEKVQKLIPHGGKRTPKVKSACP